MTLSNASLKEVWRYHYGISLSEKRVKCLIEDEIGLVERYFSTNWWGIWTAFLPREEGIWTSQSSKSKLQMPGGGGMLNFRIDRRINVLPFYAVVNLLRWLPYDNWQWLMLRIFAAVLSRIFYGECLTTTDNGFCCESLRQFCCESFTVNALPQLTMAFAANLCGSSVANLLRWMPYDNWQWLLLRIFAAVLSQIFYGECLTTTDNGFCCESLRQFSRESFTVNALPQLTMAFAANLCGSSVANLLRWMPYDNWQWLLLRIFAAVPSRIFYGECHTTTDNGFCCESLRQFFRESFTVNALRQLTMAFAANLCGSSFANLLRWMPYHNWQWLLLRIFAAVLSRIFYGECLTTTDNGFCCESWRQFFRESFTVIVLRQLTMACVSKLCSSVLTSAVEFVFIDLPCLVDWTF